MSKRKRFTRNLAQIQNAVELARVNETDVVLHPDTVSLLVGLAQENEHRKNKQWLLRKAKDTRP